MNNKEWFKYFPGAITVTDAHGIILEINEASAKMYKANGGYALIDRNAITCHKEPAQTKVREIYETQSLNVYSITKNGKKKLVYQAPYFVKDKFSGIVEIVLNLPDHIPHFNRDKK